jgi:ribosomal protein S18 acetylase RimI-like enzyme
LVKVRSLAENELDFLLDMMYESIHIPDNKPTKEVLLNLPHIKKYNEGWGRKGDRALIALNGDNQLLGAVWYRLFVESNQGYGYVNDFTPELGIAVTKDARGMGIGHILMKKIIQQVIDDGYNSLSLSVDPTNKNAVHLYKNLGFKQCGSSGTSITMVYNIEQ